MKREDVKQALLKAYEAGWRGSLELKEEYAEEALNDLVGKEEEKKEEQQMLSLVPSTVGWSDQSVGQAWSNNTVSSNWVANRSNWSTIEIPNVEIPNAETLESPDLEEEIIVPVDPEEDTPLDGMRWDDEI